MLTFSKPNHDVQNLSFQGVLTKSKYYSAIGSVTDSALSRVLHDILELPDIPEVESHRLSELCHIFNSLEGLFSEDPEQVSLGSGPRGVPSLTVGPIAFFRRRIRAKLA